MQHFFAQKEGEEEEELPTQAERKKNVDQGNPVLALPHLGFGHCGALLESEKTIAKGKAQSPEKNTSPNS